MPDYVYLDSNAFWLMKPEDKDFDGEFRNTIERLRQRYRFPFSEAHFLDIAAGDLPGKEHYVARDLAFLAEVSQGYGVALDEGERKPPDESGPAPGPVPGGGLPWIVHPRFRDVAAEYRTMPKDLPQEPSFHFEGTSHEVNLNKLHKNHPLRQLLQAAQGVFSPELLQGYAAVLWEGRDDPKTYRTFREWAAAACEMIGAKGTLLGPDTAEGLAPLKTLMSAKEPNEISATLVKATDTLCLIKRERLESLPWPERLVRAYNLLDFHPDLWEPISKKNRPSNMRLDSKHLIYAAGAKHFITEDRRFAAKATVTFTAFGIKTKVSDRLEFMARFD
jgi:hypothetical protein